MASPPPDSNVWCVFPSFVAALTVFNALTATVMLIDTFTNTNKAQRGKTLFEYSLISENFITHWFLALLVVVNLLRSALLIHSDILPGASRFIYIQCDKYLPHHQVQHDSNVKKAASFPRVIRHLRGIIIL